MPAVLGYWKIRGLAQPIRLLLVHAGVEFEDKRYEDRSEWFDKDKPNLGLDFPNLPYYIDDDVKLTESDAIHRYIARKHNLYGTNDQERSTIDMVQSVVKDCHAQFSRLCYGSAFDDEARAGYKADAKVKFDFLDAYLSGKKFVLGDKLSFVDFCLYELVDKLKIYDASFMAQFKNLLQSAAAFEALPAVAAYKKSDQYIERPVNNTIAKWK